MKRSEHLTKEQIAAYAARSPQLARSETDEIEIHLLQCAACRDSMPAPTVEQFLSALFDETELGESFEIENPLPSRSPVSTVFAFLRQPLALGALALIVIAGVSFLIWRGAAKQSNSSSEVAQTVEAPKTETNLPSGENSPASTDSENQTDAKPQGNSRPQPRSNQVNDKLSAVAENSEKPRQIEDREVAEMVENTPPAVSSLRSNGQTVLRGGNDGKRNSVAAAPTFALLAPVGETVTESALEFRWEKVSNAKSYRITIFDEQFNEVLTAEISENAFKPDKSLKPGAKYLWRVAANTENGEIVAPLPPQPPAMFRIARKNSESRIQLLMKNKTDRLKLAVFYAEEGMLEAARCTLTEILSNNPNRKAARRLLAKVDEWQKENQPAVQRCASSPISTKEAQ